MNTVDLANQLLPASLPSSPDCTYVVPIIENRPTAYVVNPHGAGAAGGSVRHLLALLQRSNTRSNTGSITLASHEKILVADDVESLMNLRDQRVLAD